jgi:molybdenum cofactor guanylyltransferase
MAVSSGDITAAAISINLSKMNRSIIGVVMCGGQSSRMGSDKGMLMTEGISWAKSAFNKFGNIGIPAIISVNKNQVSGYREDFPEDLLLVDCVDAFGPLAGVLSVHKKFPQHDLFLLACDMKDMGVEYLNILYKSWLSQNNSFDCFLYKNEGRHEPLAGIYTGRFLSKVFISNDRKEISDYSMKSVIRKGNIFEIEVTGQMKHHFKNYNRPSELEPGIL